MLILLIIILYFLPTFNAYSNKKRNAGSVFVINFFLGWSIIGWIVALSMSMGKDAKPTVVVKETEKKSSAEELTHLFDLKQKGAISQEEFEAHKKKILG